MGLSKMSTSSSLIKVMPAVLSPPSVQPFFINLVRRNRLKGDAFVEQHVSFLSAERFHSTRIVQMECLQSF